MKAEEEDVDIDSMVVVDEHGRGGANAGSGVTSPTTPAGQATPGLVTVNGIITNGTTKTEATPLPTPGVDTEPGMTARPATTPKAGEGDAIMSPVGETSNPGGGTCTVSLCLAFPLLNLFPAAVVEVDPDILWAQEEPDDDLPSLWKMKIVMEEDEDE